MVMYAIASWTNTASNVLPEPDRPHVALDVLALGVQPAAHVEHLR